MVAFRPLDDADPVLAQSPLVRGLAQTIAYITEHGDIPLTPSKAFKRVFVHWAARAFDWPDHTEADLFAVNKVLNEMDFMPLVLLHHLMIAMKLGRHYKGAFKLTKTGQALAGHPGQIFGTVTPFFLFDVDHAAFSRFDDEPMPGNWAIFLNILNIETEDGATGAHLREVCFGAPETGPYPRYDRVMGNLYARILRPLCWAGLLQQARGADRYSTEQTSFMKTPLWRTALRLETDGIVRPAQRH